MASQVTARQVLKQVKPVLSTNSAEARRRVLNLYKTWYRQVPQIVFQFHIPVNVKQGREKLREKFLINKHVKDIRQIDMLVIKGQMELVETMEIWKQKGHVMMFFDDSVNKQPTEFLSKFYNSDD